MKWLYFYLTVFILKTDLPYVTKIKPIKRCGIPEISKAGCTHYNKNLFYKNWERSLEESSEMAVFRHFEEQHEVYLSVTTGSHIMLEKKSHVSKGKWKDTCLLNQTWGKEIQHGERLPHENLLTK